MKFSIDENGYPFVETEDKYRVLADFLRGDVQADVSYTDELIVICDKIAKRELPMWEGTGNAHTLTIKSDGVCIFNEYTECDLMISSLDEFRSYLLKWRDLILVND